MHGSPTENTERLVIFGSLFGKDVLFFQVPLEGFKALQGISGPQRFQIHKAYGAPDRLPSAHTWYVSFSLNYGLE